MEKQQQRCLFQFLEIFFFGRPTVMERESTFLSLYELSHDVVA